MTLIILNHFKENTICGLIGAAGKLSVKCEKAVKMLLELDTTRGFDSTGLLTVGSNGDYSVAKAVGTPWDLYQHSSFSMALRKVNHVLMGHNRWATKGGVTRATAHPFEFDTLVGAHNGTLRRQSLLDDSEHFAVDSENLYYHMDKHGLDDTLNKTDGAFALTWYNLEDSTLNFIRNSERPLHYTMSDGGNMFWASEAWMLTVALSKNGIVHGDVIEFKERHHYHVEVKLNVPYGVHPIGQLYYKDKTKLRPAAVVAKNNWGWKNKYKGGNKQPKKLNDFVDTDVSFVLRSHVSSTTTLAYFSGSLVNDSTVRVRLHIDKDHDCWDMLDQGMGSEFKCRIRAQGVFGGDSYLLPDYRTLKAVPTGEVMYDWDGTLVSEEDWEKLASKKDCVWCSSPIVGEAKEGVKFLAGGDCLCPVCADQPELKDFINN